MAYQIFICYRWADTAGVAGRLYDILEKEYGEGNVFFDVEREGGAERLDTLVIKAVRSSAVVLVLIGQRWFVPIDGRDQPRLFRKNDVVRTEIETALESAVPIIPVLVEGGTVPQQELLPSSVQALGGLTGFELNNRFWRAGLDRLLPAIEATVLNRSQLTVLDRGKEAWQRWRAENPEFRPRLVGADLRERDLAEVDFSQCDLTSADLRKSNLTGCCLTNADLSEANLENAVLVSTDLTGAVLQGADLASADLSAATLEGADLRNANLNDVEFGRAVLKGCQVWGVSAWGARLREAAQSDLRIGRDASVGVSIDDVAFASLFSLLQDSNQFRDLIDALTQKCVLVLGRFTAERIPVMQGIDGKLRELGFLPILFDFQRPTQRDFTETIKTLAGLSRFIVAEVSNPKSAPLQLQAVVPDYQIPLVPLLQEGEEPFAMFADLRMKYDWVVDVRQYDSVDNLLRNFEGAVVKPALEKAKQLQLRKAKVIKTRHLSEYLDESEK